MNFDFIEALKPQYRLDIVHHMECYGVNFCNCASLYEDELRKAIKLDYFMAMRRIGK